MTEYRLISSDSHVTMPDTAWQEYLDPEYRDRAPRIESTDEGDFRIFEGNRTPIMTLDNLAGKKPEEFSLNVRRLDDQRAGARDPIERIKDMDTDSVDAEILYFGGPLRSEDPGLRLNSVRGYNRWLADYCSHAPGRLLGMAAIPTDTPELAAAEIRFAAEVGLRGGAIALFPPEGEYGDARWEPMWRAFLEAGFPVGLHVGSRRPGVPGTRFDSASGFMTGLVMSKLTLAEAISDLIHGLVMQRHPESRPRSAGSPSSSTTWTTCGRSTASGPRASSRSGRASTSSVRCSRRSWRTRWACGNVTRSGSTTSCGRATTRTPRRPGRTRRASPTSGSRRTERRTRPRSSGATAPACSE